MNILFIRDYPLIDGTFTLLVRLAENAKVDGHQPYFLFLQKNIDSELKNRIKGICPVFYIDELSGFKENNNLPLIDIIHGILSGDSLLKAYDTIKKEFFPSAGIVIGFYHPRTFIAKTYIWPSFDLKMYKDLFTPIPSRNLLFMNSSVKKEHEIFFKLNFTEAAIVPLIVDIPEEYSIRPVINKNKIVSIGRLVYFKNYITPLINIVSSLNKKGYAFEFHIYGDGEMYTELKSLIETNNAGSFIFLHGSMNYGDFNGAVSDALLFAGMGTSVIESSARGVPSLLAIESRHDDATYGWFFDQQGYEVGEQMPGLATHSYEQYILEAYHASAEEYEILCEKSWKKSLQFSRSAVMKKYYNFLSNANRDFTYLLPVWKKNFLKIMRQPLKMKFLVHKDYRGR